MPQLPRAAAGPKLSPLQVELDDVDRLGPEHFGDDELVTELRCGELAIAGIANEFVELASVEVGHGSLATSRWRRSNWVDVQLRATDGANATFTESGWHRTAWTDCRLTGLSLAGCTLQDVTFTDCLLDMANLRFTNFKRVGFTRCRLIGADFSNAMLNEVTFDDCTLDEATFAHARSEVVLVDGGSIAGIKGLDGLRGASIRHDQVVDLAREMAAALGLQLVD